MTELESLLTALASSGGGAVLATLVRVDGSAYRGPGARMLVRRDGTSVGAISGGCLEKDVAAHAEQVRAASKPRLVSYDLTAEDDKPWGLNMGCNAVLDVLLEPCKGVPDWLSALAKAESARETVVLTTSISGEQLGLRALRAATNGERTRAEGGLLHEVLPPPIALLACGDGPDTAPLLALAGPLGWHVRAVRKDEPLGALDARTAAIVMTHNYGRDLDLLGALLPSGAGYVGVLGPRTRTDRLLADLDARGVKPTGAQLARLHAPVGLDIGAETPSQIALAVTAEVQAAFAARAGGPLQGRKGPIHDRR
jgi:xanthine/CO dehydrogenase XdhC/CoxF family maturation factor